MDKKRNMKRRGLQLCLAAAMTLCLMLFVSGCAEKEVDMTMGETTVVEERAEITPVNLLVSEKVYPPVSDNYAMGWEADDGKVYAVLEADLKNLTGEEAQIKDLCQFQMVIGEETYGNTIAAGCHRGRRKLDRSETIGSGKTARVYLITELDAKAVSEESSLQMACFRKMTRSRSITTSWLWIPPSGLLSARSWSRARPLRRKDWERSPWKR